MVFAVHSPGTWLRQLGIHTNRRRNETPPHGALPCAGGRHAARRRFCRQHNGRPEPVRTPNALSKRHAGRLRHKGTAHGSTPCNKGARRDSCAVFGETRTLTGFRHTLWCTGLRDNLRATKKPRFRTFFSRQVFTQFSKGKKYVPCILKYVRHISKYVGHIFSFLRCCI